MALKKIKQVKSDKGFKIWDLIVYGVIIVLVVVLFIVVFTTRDTSSLKGIRIYLVNDVIYEYSFEKGEVSRDEALVEIVGEDTEKLVLKVTTGKGGYNVVEIDKSGVVVITEANCDTQECVHGNLIMSPVLKDNSGNIYCQPHFLNIVPYDYDFDNGNLII